MQHCPCHSGAAYAHCCAPFHQGKAAPTAALLMRSRYCAYALKLAEYLNATWHPDTLSETINAASLAGIQWLGLTIHEAQAIDADHATVRFTAEFALGDGETKQMTENSRFLRVNGRWLYLDGTHEATI